MPAYEIRQFLSTVPMGIATAARINEQNQKIARKTV
jgi:hypothetical protein